MEVKFERFKWDKWKYKQSSEEKGNIYSRHDNNQSYQTGKNWDMKVAIEGVCIFYVNYVLELTNHSQAQIINMIFRLVRNLKKKKVYKKKPFQITMKYLNTQIRQSDRPEIRSR